MKNAIVSAFESRVKSENVYVTSLNFHYARNASKYQTIMRVYLITSMTLADIVADIAKARKSDNEASKRLYKIACVVVTSDKTNVFVVTNKKHYDIANTYRLLRNLEHVSATAILSKDKIAKRFEHVYVDQSKDYTAQCLNVLELVAKHAVVASKAQLEALAKLVSTTYTDANVANASVAARELKEKRDKSNKTFIDLS